MRVEKVSIVSCRGTTEIRLNDGEPLKGVKSVIFKHNVMKREQDIALTVEILPPLVQSVGEQATTSDVRKNFIKKGKKVYIDKTILSKILWRIFTSVLIPFLTVVLYQLFCK